MAINSSALTAYIKSRAYEMGFLDCGVSKSGFLENQAPVLEKWLKEDRHGKMGYMENHIDKRLNPQLLVPGSKSVISLLYNYYTPKNQSDTDAPKVSKYAYGMDYHFVVKNKLKSLIDFITEFTGDFDHRIFVDSAPVMDKVWAQKSGLGWMGKNTNIIRPKNGSYFFICEIICDLDLLYDAPIKDYCGTCTKCIDACPTDALRQPYVIDASKCISYLTIELKDEIPLEFKGKMENWVFGCDICQEVCPWNRFSQAHKEPLFGPNLELLGMNTQDWDAMGKDVFQKVFKKSAVKRTKYEGLKRNLNFIKPI